MSSSGSWALMERLTNDEYLKLLPYLGFAHVYLTQVFIPKKKWIHLFDVNFQTLQVKCVGCSRQVKFQDIRKHLKQSDHQMALRSNVKQFYHPFYTYGKGDIKLSRGDHVTKDMRESSLRELHTQMKSFKNDCLMAKHFAEAVGRVECKAEDDQLLQLTLNAVIEKPNDMFVKVCLPFEDIPKLLFCVNGGEWKPVVGYKKLIKNANFHCNICSINCSGIGSLNSHVNGYNHKLRQLELLGMRYESSSKVNKNCCLQFDDSFSFSVKDEARDFFKDQLEKSSAVSGSSALGRTEPPNEIAKKVSILDEIMPDELTSKNLECHDIVGHLGVEYVLKIMKHENDREPKFECGLCEFVGDINKIQRHLLNYDHKKKYLDMHYSDTIKKYETALGHMRYMEFRAVMNEIVEKVAIEVEKTHSRSLPYTVSAQDYKTRRPDLIAEVYALLHASQNRGPSFSNIFSMDEVRNLKKNAADLAEIRTYKSIENVIFTIPPPSRRVYLNQSSHDPVTRLSEFNAKKRTKTRTSRTSRSISPVRTQIQGGHDGDAARSEKSRTRNRDKRRTRSRSPTSFDRNRSPKRRGHRPEGGVFVNVNHQNIWDVYRREIAIAANEIELAYENYRKNPEGHPLYEEEWNDFWQRRKKELEREGVNHRDYNFQPEWVHYFKQRIEQLFGEALHKSQINIRRKLEIPLDAEEDCQHDPLHDDSHIQERPRHPEENDEFRGNKRHSSMDYRGGPPHNKRQFTEEQFAVKSDSVNAQQQQHQNMSELTANISDNHSNVVHVLRLMTALEEHLGSLGVKVMDLLSYALQLEKNFRGNNLEFEAKILTASNCHLLETAMEKLKGILFAGLLEEKKVSGFKRIIQYTTNLLKYAEKMGWRQEIMIEPNLLHGRDNRDMQKRRNSNGGNMQTPNEKPLSDTLMDLVSSSHRNKLSMKMSEEQYSNSTDHQSMPLVCPPPPTIKGSNLSANLYAAYNNQPNSGLAAFNTKLSIDQPKMMQSRQQRNHQSLQTDVGHLHRNSNIGGNNLNNNSFKNSNDARTNINSRPNTGPILTGLVVGSSINNSNNGPGTHFKNTTQFIPNNMGHNNGMYQARGGGGGNRNQNWSRSNNVN